LSLLGWSVGLFVAAGAFHLVIGLLTPVFGFPPHVVGLSSRTDQATWNRTSDELLADPVVHDLRVHHHIVIAGLLVGFGVAEIGLAWAGLRQGQPFALYALTASGAVMLPYWTAMILQFTRAGTHVRLGDLQPFVWVPSILWLPATILGWLALRAPDAV
jgi:hypothetical protein